MDEEVRTSLRGAYQFLYGQQKALGEVMVVTFALQKALQELGPDAAKLYAKHYVVAQQGRMKSEGDGVLEALSQVIRQLSDS
jgi:hypothetical protein